MERVGRHDNFFELGGHSLLAMRVLARLRSKGLELPMPLLMGGGTPASLASAMESVAVDEVFEV